MKRATLPLIFAFLLTPLLSAATTVASNETVARRIFSEILTNGHFELATELYAPDFVNHGRTRDVGLDVDQAAARGWLKAFPDLKITPVIIIGEGDLVAVLWQASGTNSGEGNGVPATGRKFCGRGITVWRVEDGRVKEEWSEFGQLALMKQLGLLQGVKPVDAPQAAAPVEQSAKAATPATIETNRAIVRSVFERIVGRGELSLFDSIYAKTFVNHGIAGTSALKDEIEGTNAFRQLAPDLSVETVKTIAQGDLVAIIYKARGTNSGSALGLPATGRAFSIRGMSMMRVANGRITDEWSILDHYQTLEEIALMPPTK